MAIETGIDLNFCVPGQQVKLRDERIVTYNGLIDDNEIYTHNVNGYSYMSNGRFWAEDTTKSKADVVEILPMGKPRPKLDLNTCVPRQKVRLRDGKINYYTGPIKDGYGGKYTHQINGDSYMNNGCYWADYRESELDVVEILPVEEEPAKTATELTHSITDQIDVTSPDHVSIIPHEHGVTISIKKGLTTVSWRHYNS